ncbi:MAG: hypothetical protein RR313_03640 [Anaerovoracaceae bacterium]
MDLSNEILDAIEIMINNRISDVVNDVSNGIVTAINSDGTYQVNFRDKSFPLKLIGGHVPTVNSVVKVFVPKNNMSQAFIIY